MNKSKFSINDKILYTMELLTNLKICRYEIVTIGNSDVKNNPLCAKFGPDFFGVFAYIKDSRLNKGRLENGKFISSGLRSFRDTPLWEILRDMDRRYATADNFITKHFNDFIIFCGGCGNGKDNGQQYQTLRNAPLINGTYIFEKDSLESMREDITERIHLEAFESAL
jgi:hypothetical protein